MEDFRKFSFDERPLLSYGKVLGRHYYWKIYASENILRLMIHSVLSVQMDNEWWETAVDDNIKREAARVRTRYVSGGFSKKIPAHNIYCVYLPMIEKILFDNHKRFLVFFTEIEIENLIISLNAVINPRNLLGHMNTLDTSDRAKIGELYNICKRYIKKLSQRNNFELKYP